MSDTDGGMGGTPFSPEQLAFITELVSSGVTAGLAAARQSQWTVAGTPGPSTDPGERVFRC